MLTNDFACRVFVVSSISNLAPQLLLHIADGGVRDVDDLIDVLPVCYQRRRDVDLNVDATQEPTFEKARPDP